MAWNLKEDYTEPTRSNYLKFAEGENTFRILEGPITGWEYWKTDGDKRKPVRVHDHDIIEASELEISNITGELERPKYFWCMIVWNCNENRIQILEITQARVRKAIVALTKSKGWGDPMAYDITVTKTGEGKETEYAVMPNPKEELKAEIKSQYESAKINLDALYLGEDPFSEMKKDEVVDTDMPGFEGTTEVLNGITLEKKTEKVTDKDKIELDDIPF